MAENKTMVRVIYADTDAMGVVYHTNYIKWFEVGRTELLRSMGYAYSRMEREGLMLPVIECNCKYKTPAVYDDLVEITAKFEEVKGATVSIEYEIRRSGTGELLAIGMTKHAVTDKSFKPVRLRTVNPELYHLMKKGNHSKDVE